MRMTEGEGAALRMTEEEGFVRNDRGRGASFGMTGEEGCLGWQNLARVISSEARNLKLETGGCATILDSSLRYAAFRMTGWRWLRSE